MTIYFNPGIYESGTTRLVEAKGDIQDIITNLDLKTTPFFSTFRHRKVQDPNPKTLTDSLLAVNTTAQPYGGAAQDASDTARASVTNWCQRMTGTISVSDEQDELAQYGMGSETAYQKPKTLIELKRSIEYVIASEQVVQAPTSANSDTGEMNGMATIISTTTNDTFSQANFDADMATVVAAGGRPTVAYMDATHKIAVGAWTSNATRYTTETKKLEQEVLLYHSDLGEVVTMLWHHLMAADIDSGNDAEFMCIQPDLWEVCDYIRMKYEELAFVGGARESQWVWNGTILCKAEEGNFLYY